MSSTRQHTCISIVLIKRFRNSNPNQSTSKLIEHIETSTICTVSILITECIRLAVGDVCSISSTWNWISISRPDKKKSDRIVIKNELWSRELTALKIWNPVPYVMKNHMLWVRLFRIRFIFGKAMYTSQGIFMYVYS